MKKQLKLIIALIIVSIIGFLGYSIYGKINHKKEVAARIKTVPAFSFKTLDGNLFTNKNLDETKPKLFIYFNSDCEFCQSEAESIHKQINNLNKVQLIFVSFEEIDKIKTFATHYQLLNVDNIIFLEDANFKFEPLFDAKGIPFMLLYSKDNRLIKKFNGVTKVENILKYVE